MRKLFFFGFACLMLLVGCSEEDLDMTVLNKSLFENETITKISAHDAWTVSIVQDSMEQYVELEYSAFLDPYLSITKESEQLQIGFSQSLNIPYNAVFKATIHCMTLQGISLSDAVMATMSGTFTGQHLTMELDDASTCKGCSFVGNCDLKMKGAAIVADATIHGEQADFTMSETSMFKGSLYLSESFSASLAEGAKLITYGGSAPEASIVLKEASHANMNLTQVDQMTVDLSSASEAYVMVAGILSGSLKEASMLYYCGNPTLTVDCDDTSTLQPNNK